MGLNICLYIPRGNEHPDWDWSKHAGDREFPLVTSKLGRVYWTCEGIQFDEKWDYWRPANIAAWRRVIAEHNWPNPGRFEKLMDLLEAHPQYWIYLSY